MCRLIELMCMIFGFMSIFAGKSIYEVMCCFAVAALFNIASSIGGGKKKDE